MDSISDFLFARPSFLEGLARVLDIRGTLQTYNQSESGEVADRTPFAMDMQAIGQDMRTAMDCGALQYEGK